MPLLRSLDSSALRVGIVGAGPAGLYIAIALAQRGHHVVVTDRIESPRVRGTCMRNRSYVMDISARGMAALDQLPGVMDEGSALRRHTLPFLGHRSHGKTYALTRPGLIGTRDDTVLGLLVHIEDCQPKWPGSIQVYFGVATYSVDLRSQRLSSDLAHGSDASAHVVAAVRGPYDLIVACDGRNSTLRTSAAAQDPELKLTSYNGRAGGGAQAYKTFNLDVCDEIADDIAPGWLHMAGRCVYARVPTSGAVGIMPLDNGCEEALQPDLLNKRVPQIMKYITAAEAVAFDSRAIFTATGGFVASKLYAGDCMALVGDSATSLAPPGQGGDHAFDAACEFIKAIDTMKSPSDIPGALRTYNDARMPDERGYATWDQPSPYLPDGQDGWNPEYPSTKDSVKPYRECGTSSCDL